LPCAAFVKNAVLPQWLLTAWLSWCCGCRLPAPLAADAASGPRRAAARAQVRRCLSIKGAEDLLNKPHAFEISTTDDSMFFIADTDKARAPWHAFPEHRHCPSPPASMMPDCCV